MMMAEQIFLRVDDKELRRMLEQWGRAQRIGADGGHCASAEWRWILHNPARNMWEPPQPRPPEINMAEVMAVERAIGGRNPLPPRNRYAIIGHYAWRMSDHAICMWCRRYKRVITVLPGGYEVSAPLIIREREIEKIRREGELMIRNRLTHVMGNDLIHSKFALPSLNRAI